METHIYLIRHGQTSWNQEQRVQGHQDIPLSTAGKNEATKLGKRFSQASIDYIYASDLIRARETAEQIAKHHPLPIASTPALRERFLGEWEGLRMSQVKERYPKEWKEVWRYGGRYGVEGVDSMRKRMLTCLQEMTTRHPGKRIVVVSHGGAIRTIVKMLHPNQQEQGDIKVLNTAVNHLIHHPQSGWQIGKINCVNHLQAGEGVVGPLPSIE